MLARGTSVASARPHLHVSEDELCLVPDSLLRVYQARQAALPRRSSLGLKGVPSRGQPPAPAFLMRNSLWLSRCWSFIASKMVAASALFPDLSAARILSTVTRNCFMPA